LERNIYVFGHINPDTDSICSAIAYAHLKRALGYKHVVAARLGKINKETTYALNYFDVKEPILIENIKPQVGDTNYYAVPPIYLADSVKKVWDIMTTQHRQMLPVLFDDGKLAGIISMSDIAKTYIGLTDGSVLKNHTTPFSNIVSVLEGQLVSGSYPDTYIQGDVFTTDSIGNDTVLSPLDIVITGSKNELIISAINTGAGCVIITQQDTDHIPLDRFKNSSCAIVCTPYSFFTTIKMISQSISVKDLIRKNNVVYFETDDTLDEVKEIMLKSPYRTFPIIDEEGQVRGIISKRHLIDIKKKKVILVDHNEKTQSALGIEQAEILEIIDHHRIANIDTQIPVFLYSEPVGCTCTIIANMYEQHGITPPKSIAGIMLSAILSDTLLFKSPTCTDKDIQAAKKLAKLADVDILQYGRDLLIFGTSLEGMSAKEILHMDMKRFALGKYNISVSQVNTGDFKSLFDIKDALVREMEYLATLNNLDVIMLMVTDIVLGGTELITYGRERWITERAFDLDKEDISVFLPGVYSRKQQIIPKLMMTIQNS
jgi:manganese-dependent inorganic pyrophosphatase